MKQKIQLLAALALMVLVACKPAQAQSQPSPTPTNPAALITETVVVHRLNEGLILPSNRDLEHEKDLGVLIEKLSARKCLSGDIPALATQMLKDGKLELKDGEVTLRK